MGMTCNLVATPAEWIPVLTNDGELLDGLMRCASEAHFDALYEALESSLPVKEAARLRARRAERRASHDPLFAGNPRLAEEFARDKAAKERFRARFGASPPVLGLEKDWDVLNYALTKAVAARGGDTAVAAFLMTGAPIGNKQAPARMHSPEGVRQIAETLAPLDGDQMAAQLDFDDMAQQRVYGRRSWTTEDGRDGWLKTVEGSGGYLLEFIAKAAAEGRALIIDMSY